MAIQNSKICNDLVIWAKDARKNWWKGRDQIAFDSATGRILDLKTISIPMMRPHRLLRDLEYVEYSNSLCCFLFLRSFLSEFLLLFHSSMFSVTVSFSVSLSLSRFFNSFSFFATMSYKPKSWECKHSTFFSWDTTDHWQAWPSGSVSIRAGFVVESILPRFCSRKYYKKLPFAAIGFWLFKFITTFFFLVLAVFDFLFLLFRFFFFCFFFCLFVFVPLRCGFRPRRASLAVKGSFAQ